MKTRKILSFVLVLVILLSLLISLPISSEAKTYLYKVETLENTEVKTREETIWIYGFNSSVHHEQTFYIATQAGDAVYYVTADDDSGYELVKKIDISTGEVSTYFDSSVKRMKLGSYSDWEVYDVYSVFYDQLDEAVCLYTQLCRYDVLNDEVEYESAIVNLKTGKAKRMVMLSGLFEYIYGTDLDGDYYVPSTGYGTGSGYVGIGGLACLFRDECYGSWEKSGLDGGRLLTSSLDRWDYIPHDIRITDNKIHIFKESLITNNVNIYGDGCYIVTGAKCNYNSGYRTINGNYMVWTDSECVVTDSCKLSDVELADGKEIEYEYISKMFSGTDGKSVVFYDTDSNCFRRISPTVKTVPATGVSLDKSSLSLNVGESSQLTATVTPSDATDKSVVWTSSNTSVATVSGGTVKAVSPGSATITVKTNDGGYTSSCSVVVSAVNDGKYTNIDHLLTYTVSSGVATITGTSEDVSGNITFSSEIDGYPIEEIGEEAFMMMYDIEGIKIPEGVKKIGKYAFWFCDGITSVELPESLVEIGSNAFAYCESLESINLPANLDSFAVNFLDGCSALSEITVSGDDSWLEGIDGVLFADGSTLAIYPAGKMQKSYTVPSSVESIAKYAFSYNPYIESIAIPSSVSEILCSFNTCESLKEITVATSNSAYSSENGVLYNKRKTKLISYPANKSGEKYNIPQGVVTISEGAFKMSMYLKNLVIPSSVMVIESSAFRYFSQDLTVHFEGTEAEWSEISIGSNNPDLTSADIIYNYTEQDSGEKLATIEAEITSSSTRYYFDVKCSEFENGAKVLVCLYDANGGFLGISVEPLMENEVTSLVVSKNSDAKSARIFIIGKNANPVAYFKEMNL